jgi:hypothetical protein
MWDYPSEPRFLAKTGFPNLYAKEMVWTPPTRWTTAEAFGGLKTNAAKQGRKTGGASQSTASSAKVVLCIATP